MSAQDRKEIIKQKVTTEKKVVVSELSELFQVTEETIRRDLEKLETEGVLTRTYGGAVLNASTQTEGVHFYKRAKKAIKEKQQIALKILPLLQNKTTMSVDSSTTVMEAVKLLKDRSELTLLTNSTAVFQQMAQSKVKIVSTGGEFNKSALSLQGQLAKEMVQKYFVDIMLMSCKGLDMESGALDSNEGEAEIKKVMIEQAAEIALLVDSSKFDRKAFVQLIDLEKVNYIVTDKKPNSKWLDFCEDHAIEIIY